MAGFTGSPPGLSTDPLWAASGDIVYATGDDASSVLAVGSAGYVLTVNCDSTLKWAAGFTGPACSTDNAIPTFHGTGGATFQDTTVTISDSNVLTADAGIVVDNLTINCCAITATSGFTVDATGDIVFDADGDDITFKAGSDDSTGLAFTNSGGTWTVKAGTANADLIFNVNDGCVDTKVMAIDGGDSVVTFGGNSVKSGEIRILEDTDSGANYTAFKVGNMAANVTYTLPTNVAASCGLFLKSTCAGVLSWAAAGGAAQIATGSYTGDGAVSLAVTAGLSGQQIKMVTITQRGTSAAGIADRDIMWTTDVIVDDHTDGLAYNETTGAGNMETRTSAIIALGCNSFTVDDNGVDSDPNKCGVVYNFIVWGGG